MKNNIIKYAFLAILGAFFLTGCVQEEPFDEITELDLTRCMMPRELAAEVENGDEVTFSWVVTKEAASYTLLLSEDEGFGATAGEYAIEAGSVPFVVKLSADKTYYWKVQAHSPTISDSKWAVADEPVTTSAVRSSMNPVVKDRTETTVTIVWDNADDKTDLTSVWAELLVPGEGDERLVIPVTDSEISACTKTIEGLTAGKEYKFTLIFGKSGSRGTVVACTRPDMGSGVVTVSTAAGLISAIDKAGSAVRVQIAYSEDPIDLKGAYPDPMAESITVNGDLYLYGTSTAEGKKPVVNFATFKLASGAKVVHIEDIAFEGDGMGTLVDNADADLTAFELVNCELSGFGKGFYSVAESATTSGAATLLVEGCYMHDINADGKTGGDFLDIRGGTTGDIIIRRSTFYACARSFIRLTNKALVGTVLLENCTFNYVTATPSSSNNRGIFSVSVSTGATSVKAVKNVFLNEYNEAEGTKTAKECWIRLSRSSNDSFRPDCSGNLYYNVGAGFMFSTALDVSNPSDLVTNGEVFEAVAMTDGEVLKEDPCVNSAAGKLYLSAAGAKIATLKAGDPRWWNAVQPEVIRETELTVQEEDYTWDFTEKTIYDTEDLELNTIIGNARIYASEDVPAHVVMSKGIDFESAAVVGSNGVPTCSAVEILTSGYGAVKVTAESSDGLGTLQVLAGGDRYAVLADGEEHTVLLGDLTGENSIYVIAGSAVTLKKITWTKDLTPETVLEALSTPKVTVTPNKLDEGTAEDVVISWPEVENAADYVVTINGAEHIVTVATYTIAAAEVAALAVGEYAISVIARPVSTSSKYEQSEAGEAKLKINEVITGGEVTLTWDFSSAEWQAALEANAASAKGSNQTGWTVSLDGLTFSCGSKNGKWDASGYIQPNGAGSTTDRVFTFNAPADGVLKITAATASAGNPRDVAVMDATGVEQVQSVDAKTVLEFDVKAGDVFFYPKSGVRFYVIEFTYATGAEIELTWDFSTAEWQNVLETNAASAKGSNQAGWSVSLDGLTFTCDAKNGKWDASGYIQPNGSGSTTDRVFKFTAPADGILIVSASTASSGNVRDVAVMDASGVEQVQGVDARTDLEFEVKAGEVAIYPKAGVRFYVIKFKYQGAAASPQEWDFASAEWQAALEANAASAKGSNQTGWSVSLDGLTFTCDAKNGKWDPSGYIQPNGGGSATDRVFTFNAPADGTLIITAATASAGNPRDVVVLDASGVEQVQTVDAKTDLEFDIKAGDVAVYPKSGIRFYKFAYQP